MFGHFTALCTKGLNTQEQKKLRLDFGMDVVKHGCRVNKITELIDQPNIPTRWLKQFDLLYTRKHLIKEDSKLSF